MQSTETGTCRRRLSCAVMMAAILAIPRAEAQTFYVDCGPVLQTVQNATTEATSMAVLAADYCTRELPKDARPYTPWFGAYDAARAALVTRKFGAIVQRLGNITVDCNGAIDECEDVNAVAEAPATVYLCADFFSLPFVDPLNGYDQRAAMVHEVSHLPDVISTVNASPKNMAVLPVLEQAWAQQNPAGAVTWAEAYQYFAWWLPSVWSPPRSFDCAVANRPAAPLPGWLLIPGVFLGTLWARSRRRRMIMTRPWKLALCGLAIGAGVLWWARHSVRARGPSIASVAHAEQTYNPEKYIPSKPDPRLGCELVAPATVHLGEPIPVTMRLANRTDQPLLFHFAGSLWAPANRHTLSVTRDGQEVPHFMDRYAGFMPSRPTAADYHQIPPHGTIETTRDLTAKREGGFTIDQPGVLHVQLRDPPLLADVYEGATVDMERLAAGDAQAARLDCNALDVRILAPGE